MSAIQAAILKACDIDKPGKNRQAFLLDAAKAISELTDKGWGELPKEVQKWFNAAADVADANKAKNANDPLPELPDFEEDKPEESIRRRGSSSEGESAIKIGAQVTVIKKNGRELAGKLVERSKDLVVLEVDGKEREIEMDEIGSIESVNDGKGRDKDPVVELGVGSTVKLVTKRGREVEGEIVKLDDEEVVLKTKDGEEDFSRTRVESMTPVAGGKAKAEETSTRRRATTDDKDKDGKAGDGEHKRASNPGVSIGQRIRELIVDNMDATKDGIQKLLEKEKLDFRPNTLDLNFAEAHKFLKLLKDRKMLKG